MPSRRFLTVLPLTLLVAGGVGLIAACASGEADEKVMAENRDWTCERANVPMGEVLRCTSGGNSGSGSTADVPTSNGGNGSTAIRTYGQAAPKKADCGPDQLVAPPAPTPPDPPKQDPPKQDPPGHDYDCKSGSNPHCPPPDVPSNPPPAPGNESPGPDECTEGSTLPYCGGPPPPPPQPPGPGEEWHCNENSNGKKSCDGPPSCAAGSHPSKCGACVLDGEPDDCAPPSQGGCWITGGGFVTAKDKDNFGGNAKQMKDGSIQGNWNHEVHKKQDHLKGKPSYIFCRHVDEPGPGQPGGKKGFDMNQIYFGGPAEWRANKDWESGYWFDVVAKDHGEPGAGKAKGGENVDTYHLTVRKMVDLENKVSGSVVYSIAGNLSGGNVQIHPPNDGHPGFQSKLPSWVELEP